MLRLAGIVGFACSLTLGAAGIATAASPLFTLSSPAFNDNDVLPLTWLEARDYWMARSSVML
jgi:hypothetical protein